jgi:hypothetical protein
MLLPILICTAGCAHLGAEPMTFRCEDLLGEHVQTYQGTPLIAELQEYAGEDDGPREAKSFGSGPNAPEATNLSKDAVVRALSASADRLRQSPPTTLMLSGGGSWGAFGAGFLDAYGRRDWNVVTGISTGALQGVLVAAGDYSRLVEEYGIKAQEDLARTNSLTGFLAKGSQYDIRPLRHRVLKYLLEEKDGQLPFDRMARDGAPALFVGMVEARTGELKVVAVTQMVRSVFKPAAPRPSEARVRQLAECVAGVTLASSSIPVRLTPVQIDGRTYMDGGVRSSVFDAGIAERVSFAADAAPEKGVKVEPSDIYVLRNGPTVVFRDKPGKSGEAEVDERPDAMRVGLRGYSTIVNQSELMSIASLRLIYPKGTIKVMTADGFNSTQNPKPCGPRPEAVFEPAFMTCLIEWGRYRAANAPWIELSAVGRRR